MAKWYVRWTETDDDPKVQRVYRFGEFESNSSATDVLATLALVVSGIDTDQAKKYVTGADLEGMDADEDGGLSFQVYLPTAQWDIEVSREPLSLSPSYVVMCNDQPIAVRTENPTASLATIARRYKVPVAAVSVLKLDWFKTSI